MEKGKGRSKKNLSEEEIEEATKTLQALRIGGKSPSIEKTTKIQQQELEEIKVAGKIKSQKKQSPKKQQVEEIQGVEEVIAQGQQLVVKEKKVSNETEQIKEAILNNKQILKDTKIQKKYLEQQKKQEQEESKLIATLPDCNLNQLKIEQEFLLPHISLTNLKNMINQQFYNADVMIKALCAIGGVVLIPDEMKTDVVRLRLWLNSVKQIGTSSVYGIALLASLQQARDLFVIKGAQDVKNRFSLLHEVIVGMYGTNKLRKFVPNFSYILGLFFCSPILVGKNKFAITGCNNTDSANQVLYAIYENISPAVSYRSYSEKATPQQIIDKYLQILLALRLGYQQIEFTHYDLHNENVLIRRHEDFSSFSLKYDTPFGIKYIQTDGVATIIDYGMSHVYVPNTVSRNFGYYGGIQYGVLPDQPNPLFDAYKLLLFTLSDLKKKKNIPAYEEMLEIFFYFYPDIKKQQPNIKQAQEEVAVIIDEQRPLYFSVPMDVPFMRGKTLEKLIVYIFQHINLSSFVFDQPMVGSKVLSCSALGADAGCFTTDEINTKLGFTFDSSTDSSSSQPKNILDLYKLLQYYSLQKQQPQAQQPQAKIQKVVDSTLKNLPHMFDEQKKEIVDLSNLVISLLTKLNAKKTNIEKLRAAGKLDLSVFFEPENQKFYREYVEELLFTISLDQILLQKIEIGKEIIYFYSSQMSSQITQMSLDMNHMFNINLEQYAQLGAEYTKILINLGALIEEVQLDYQFLVDVQADKSAQDYIKQKIKDNREFSWYFDFLPLIDYAI